MWSWRSCWTRCAKPQEVARKYLISWGCSPYLKQGYPCLWAVLSFFCGGGVD